jgi:hypothetical protein
MEIEDLIDDYNNGNESEWMKYFNDELDVFFKYAHRRGFFDKLDILDEHQNEYLLFLYSIDKPEFYRLITEEYLHDVDMIDGKPYLTTNDKGGNLSKLFCDNRRNDLSRSTVELILNGDNDWDQYNGYDLTDNIYRDVIEELTKENLVRLKEYIVDTLTGVQVGTDTELLESIAETQGTDYATINNDNIDEIVDDEETMKELMKDELSDLRNELYYVYETSYNTAYEDQLYKEVTGELEKYFDMPNGKWSSRPHQYKKETQVEIFQVPIHNFESNILDYLNRSKGWGYNSTLEYWGSYIDVLTEDDECLSVYPSDYADSRDVDKNINMYFNDYI